MSFYSVPARSNGQKFTVAWVNMLRTAGIALEALLGGSGFFGSSTFTLANNQASAANVTGLSFAGASVRSFVVEYDIYRNTTSTGATELAETGQLIGVYSSVAGTWEMTQAPVVGAAGVTFTITNAGQVQYASTNITGTAGTSKMNFAYRTKAVLL
jgi:hypothetical protein